MVRFGGPPLPNNQRNGNDVFALLAGGAVGWHLLSSIAGRLVGGSRKVKAAAATDLPPQPTTHDNNRNWRRLRAGIASLNLFLPCRSPSTWMHWGRRDAAAFWLSTSQRTCN